MIGQTENFSFQILCGCRHGSSPNIKFLKGCHIWYPERHRTPPSDG